MAKKKTKKRKKGFTLIELLIVIAIIGILASIILVSLNSARQRAKMAEFKATASSLNSAAIVWCDAGAPAASRPVWPNGNNSGTITNAVGCSGGVGGIINAGRATSAVGQTGTACTADMGMEGVLFGASGC